MKTIQLDNEEKIIKSHAKLNLFFHLVGKNENNYYLIESIMTFIDLYDEFFITKADHFNIEFEYNEKIKFQPIDHENNTIYKITCKFLEKYGFNINDLKLKIIIKKNIPTGAGLGGGSANAATMLKFLQQYFNYYLPKQEEEKLALEIGCDTVPCLYAERGAVFIEGIGQLVDDEINFIDKDKFFILLVYPQTYCITADIYNNLKKQEFNYTSKVSNRKTIDIDTIKQRHNDLIKASFKFCPLIKDTIEKLSKFDGVLFTSMTGSGSVSFAIFDNKTKAELAAEKMQKDYPDYFIYLTKFI